MHRNLTLRAINGPDRECAAICSYHKSLPDLALCSSVHCLHVMDRSVVVRSIGIAVTVQHLRVSVHMARH